MILETKKCRNKQNPKGKYCILRCDYCGKKYERRFAHIKRNKTHCCGYSCKESLSKGRKLKKGIREKMSESKRGDRHPKWKGGIKIKRGYKYVYTPNHPNNTDNYVLESRLVVEGRVGRYLTKGEIVHHRNKDGGDNKVENLILFKNHSEHMKYHYFVRKVMGGVDCLQ